MAKNPNVGTGGDEGVNDPTEGSVSRAGVPRSQPESLSQRAPGNTTAPMNELPITLVIDTQVGGVSGRGSAGQAHIVNRTPEPGGDNNAPTASDRGPQK